MSCRIRVRQLKLVNKHADCKVVNYSLGLPLPRLGQFTAPQSNLNVLTIGTSVIQFAAFIFLLNVELGEIADTSDLNIVWSLDKVDTLEGTIRDKTRAPTRLGAPCNFLLLGNTNNRIRLSLIISSQ